MDPTGPLPLDEAERLLEKHEKAMGVLKIALSMRIAVMLREYMHPMIVTPYIASREAKLLVVDARVKSARGDPNGALADVASLWHIAMQWSRNVGIFDVFFCAKSDELGSRLLEVLLAEQGEAIADLEIVAVAPRIPLRATLVRALVMQEAGGLHTFSAGPGDLFFFSPP